MQIGLNPLGLKNLRGGGAPPPDPALVTATRAQVANAFMGFASEPSAGRFNMLDACYALRIKGSSASMYDNGSGDTTPIRVLVDSETFSARTIPVRAGGKMELFSGLSDTEHTVIIWRDNSVSGQGFPSTGTLFEAFGSAATISRMGEMYYLGDPAFPGVATGARAVTTNAYPSGQIEMTKTTTHGANVPNAAHFRATYSSVWVFMHKDATRVMVSIDGAAFTEVAVTAWDDSTQGIYGWRKLDIAASPSTQRALIITGAGNTAVGPGDVVVQGVMVVGGTIAAPSGTRRHVHLYGASQVQGTVSGAGPFRTDGMLVQEALDVYVATNGLASATITGLNTNLATAAAKMGTKDICMLSIGINSADDANFQTDYTTLIQTALNAGYTKVLARGLVQQSANNTSKNNKISAAVSSFGSAAVQYLDVSTWTATTDGAGDTIAMPDGAHPNAAGFQKMADWWVRDHASYFA